MIKFEKLVKEYQATRIDTKPDIDPEKLAIQGLHPDRIIELALIESDYKTACLVKRNFTHYEQIFLTFLKH